MANQTPPQWEFGFWFWRGSSESVGTTSGAVDVLFFQAGTIQKQFMGAPKTWEVYGRLPDRLSAAREYWAVFRSDDHHAVPSEQSIARLASRLGEIQTDAKRRGLKLVGVQLDIDAPTGSLPVYASYLTAVRKAIGPGMRLSITALLDWFRPGTAIADVVRAVDEYVPQFYDLRNPGSDSGRPEIAASIDAGKWAPVFSRYGKRFRIGISTFGRARLAPVQTPSGMYARVTYYQDLKPLDIAMNPAFALETSTNGAKEVVLRYRATRNTRVGYTDFERGSAMEFVLSTPEALRMAVGQARRMGNLCSGVVFFRWPQFNESLTAEPDEVLAAVGVVAPSAKAAQLRAVDEQCAAVHCADLYLMHTPALLAKPVRYAIRLTSELEYFLPDEKTPARMAGPERIEFVLPPYCGRVQLHLGRAVTSEKAQYSLEVIP